MNYELLNDLRSGIDGLELTILKAMRIKRRPEQEPVAPTVDDLKRYLESKNVLTEKKYVKVHLSMDLFGSKHETIYLQFDRLQLAVLHNWHACHDGMNRYLNIVPLFWSSPHHPGKFASISSIGFGQHAENVLLAIQKLTIHLLKED